MTADRPVADREPLSPLRDVTTYDARRREVAEMIAEGDAQSDDGLMGPDGLADALMEIADGWYRSALDAARAQPAVPVALCGCADAENIDHFPSEHRTGVQPAVPVVGAEPELQALAHEIAKEWTPHDHDPVKCPECAALRAAQPEDDGLARSGVDDVGEALTGLVEACDRADIEDRLPDGVARALAVVHGFVPPEATTQPERRDP